MKKFYALPAALMLVVILFISGCGENCTECCETNVVTEQLDPGNPSFPFVEFTGTLTGSNNIYYYNLPGSPARVQFFIGATNTTVCTNEHLSIVYHVNTHDSIFDRPVKIFGEVYWSIFSDEVVLVNDVLSPNHSYSGTLSDVGLKQAFPEGAAEIDVYITVEFESLGTLDLDKTYFWSHFGHLGFEYSHKTF